MILNPFSTRRKRTFSFESNAYTDVDRNSLSSCEDESSFEPNKFKEGCNWDDFETDSTILDGMAGDPLESYSCSDDAQSITSIVAPPGATKQLKSDDLIAKIITSMNIDGRCEKLVHVTVFLTRLIELAKTSQLSFDAFEIEWIEELLTRFADPQLAWKELQNIGIRASLTVRAVESRVKYRGAPSNDPRRSFKDYLNDQLPNQKRCSNRNACRLVFCACVLLFAASFTPDDGIASLQSFTNIFPEWTAGLDLDQVHRLYRCYIHMQSASVYIPLYTNKSLIFSLAELLSFSGIRCTPGGKNTKFVKAVKSMCSKRYGIPQWNNGKK